MVAHFAGHDSVSRGDSAAFLALLTCMLASDNGLKASS